MLQLGDLIVKPAYQFTQNEILTADKLNLLATPVVELALEDPVNDQNFLRNGNFYSSFWKTPASPGVSCPAGAWTTNPSYWLIRPTGGAINCFRSSVVPDLYSLFSCELQGALNVSIVEFGQQINGDLSATLRRNCTFSGYIFNGTGLVASPTLNFYTADVFNNFAAITLQTTVNIQSAPNALWTFMTSTLDLSTLPNAANGIMVAVVLPAGSLNDPTKYILFSRLKLQIGEVATEFVDDTSLFIQAPSVDATMLQDGCIARPGLFMPNVVPAGAYMAKSINNGDINDGAIDGRTLLPSASTTLSAAFTQPAVAATVPITVGSTTGFSANQPLTIVAGGAYTISSVTDATHMVVTNTGATGNAAPAATIPTAGAVTQTSAVVENLGYTPVNKAGDSGVGALHQAIDTVVHATSYQEGGLTVATTAANANNAGYMPCIGFLRPGVIGRAIGLDNATSKFKTVDSGGTVGYLLDTVNKVNGGVDIQDASITYQKLATSLINSLVPIGSVLPFAGVSPPGGWFVCDGHAVSRTTYAVLFSQLGTYWGGGDGTSTFNIPNFVNRVPVGYGSGASWGFGTYGGETSHQLSIAEMPGHDHGYSQSPHDHGTHAHTYTAVTGSGNSFSNALPVPYGFASTSTSVSGVPASNANINFTGQGGWAPHNNMPPYGVLYYIIKAL